MSKELRVPYVGMGMLTDEKARILLPSLSQRALYAQMYTLVSVSVVAYGPFWLDGHLYQAMLGRDGWVNLLDVAKEVDEVAGA